MIIGEFNVKFPELCLHKFTKSKEGKGNKLLPTLFATQNIPTQEFRL
jgi:hypothetical protein